MSCACVLSPNCTCVPTVFAANTTSISSSVDFPANCDIVSGISGSNWRSSGVGLALQRPSMLLPAIRRKRRRPVSLHSSVLRNQQQQTTAPPPFPHRSSTRSTQTRYIFFVKKSENIEMWMERPVKCQHRAQCTNCFSRRRGKIHPFAKEAHAMRHGLPSGCSQASAHRVHIRRNSTWYQRSPPSTL